MLKRGFLTQTHMHVCVFYGWLNLHFPWVCVYYTKTIFLLSIISLHTFAFQSLPSKCENTTHGTGHTTEGVDVITSYKKFGLNKGRALQQRAAGENPPWHKKHNVKSLILRTEGELKHPSFSFICMP